MGGRIDEDERERKERLRGRGTGWACGMKSWSVWCLMLKYQVERAAMWRRGTQEREVLGREAR
jgi:hypothetical protein